MEQIEQHEGVRETRRVIWGVFLIALGALFLFEHLGAFGWTHLVEWWPLIFVVIGVTHALEGRPGSAATLVLLGGWFLACESGWWGLSYGNSWGLVLVAVGTGIVIRAFTGERRRRCGPIGGAF